VDIEGNLAREDCFLSRQVITSAADDTETFFDAFIERTRHAPFASSALYAASLRHKVRPGAVPGIFESMVDQQERLALDGSDAVHGTAFAGVTATRIHRSPRRLATENGSRAPEARAMREEQRSPRTDGLKWRRPPQLAEAPAHGPSSPQIVPNGSRS
jgi:hypothetical protein